MQPTSFSRSGPAVALVAACALSLSACGSGAPVLRDASGGHPYKVSATASFPKSQKMAGTRTLRITVRNEESSRTIPDVAVVVRGLETKVPGANNGNGKLADRNRPLWIVDEPPAGGPTAYVDTWALGALKAGQERTFTWRLTPVVAGRHRISWRVAGDLDQDGPVRASGGPVSGTLDIDVAS